MLGIVASSASSGGGGGGGPTPPGPVGIVNNANTSVAALGGDVYRATKTGGADLSWDADAVSSTGFSDDFVIRFQPRQTTSGLMFAVNSDPLTNSSFNTLDYGWYLDQNGVINDFYSNGVRAGQGVSFGAAYSTSNRFFARRVGTTLTFYKGTTDTIADAVLDKTFNDVAGTLYFDSSITRSNGAFDVYAEAL